MTPRDAQAICEAPSAQDAWNYIRAHRRSFLWSDDEDPAVSWNHLFGTELGVVTAELIPGREDRLQYSHRGRRVEVQLRLNREDRIRALHGLAAIVRPDSDLRLCRDSSHSSDVAFFAMPPTDWQSLESMFGSGKVRTHFLSMDGTVESFFEVAFAAPTDTQGAPKSASSDWEGAGSYEAQKLEYILVADAPGRPRREALSALLCRYLEPGPVTVSIRGAQPTLSMDRDDVLERVVGQIGRQQIRVSNPSRTGFIVLEQNGVAAGWRTDAWAPAQEVRTPWWLFWRHRKN
jgi:hypothetical protein